MRKEVTPKYNMHRVNFNLSEVQMYISGYESHSSHSPLESPYQILKRYQLESKAFIGFYERVKKMKNNMNAHLI